MYKGQTQRLKKPSALDDRAGIASIILALRILKGRQPADESIKRGPITLIFTDKEEHGGIGAADLVDKYKNEEGACKGLLDNTHIVISVDGPMMLRTDQGIAPSDISFALNEPEKANPFVVAELLNIERKDGVSQAIYRAVGLLGHNSSSSPRYAERNSRGDHEKFGTAVDRISRRSVPVINIRSPYVDIDPITKEIKYHSPNETTDVENWLVPVARWLSESLVQLNKDLESSQPALANASGLTEKKILIIETTNERAEAVKAAIITGEILSPENIYAIAQPQAGQTVDEILRQKYGEVPNIDRIFINSQAAQLTFGCLDNVPVEYYEHIEDIAKIAEAIKIWL